jgi:hypothetical protein
MITIPKIKQVFSVKYLIISVPKEGQTSSFQSAANVDCFFYVHEIAHTISFPRVKWNQHSAAPTGRCVANITSQVAHWKLISPPPECSRSCRFVWSEMVLLPYPPYYPQLASWNYFLFPKLKFRTKGKMIWCQHNDSKTVAGCTCQVQNKGLR